VAEGTVHVVAMAAEGAAARSVRACRPGCCPAAVLLRETLAGLGPGVLRPASSRAVSARLCSGRRCGCGRLERARKGGVGVRGNNACGSSSLGDRDWIGTSW
jgi:hypothetical protein